MCFLALSLRFKQVIAVRRDLKIGRGKTAAQVAHASLTSYLEVLKRRPAWAEAWLRQGQKKVVVAVKDLEELFSLRDEAEAAGIPTALIQDAGLTQLEPGTITALGIGPAPEELIDKVTGHLSLL
jgi:PTH2 family peptidyl-tRNA hydrolase